MEARVDQAGSEGGKVVVGGGRALADEAPDAFYVRPAIVRMDEQTPVVEQETFAPLLYVLPYDDFEEAIALNNAVPQGLSSSVFTSDQAEAERFVSAEGSDCGHRQRQHRHLGRGDRWRVRRREGDRRRPRVRLRRLAGVHAPRDQHRQLLRRAAARPGRRLHRLTPSSSVGGPARPRSRPSESQDVVGGRTEGDEAVGAGDAGQAAGVAGVHEDREDALGHPPLWRVSSTTSTAGKSARGVESAPPLAAGRASAGPAPWPPPPGWQRGATLCGSGRRRCRTSPCSTSRPSPCQLDPPRAGCPRRAGGRTAPVQPPSPSARRSRVW